MNKLSAIVSVGFVASIMAAACTGGDRSGDAEETGVLDLPLSQACSSCAENAILNLCDAELDACLANDACLDVDGCFQSCASNDVACFAQCAQGSAAFEALTECVLCSSCSDACTGEWTCNGQDPPDPGGTGKNECEQCMASSTGQADCSEVLQECLAVPACAEIAQCYEQCGGDDACAQTCGANQTSDGYALYKSVLTCQACGPCANVCGDTCGTDPGTPPPPPPTDCKACVFDQTQQSSACADVAATCANTDGCYALFECAEPCGGGQDCVQQCSGNIPADASAVFAELLQCGACDACQDACPNLCM